MNDTTTQYDAIVIGSGAGGAAAAHGLVKRGWRVALLEKGPELPLDGSTLDVDKVIRQGVFKSKEPWLDKDGATFVPEEYFNLGGKTKWYGAAVLRYAAHEFEADPGHQCLPWPIRYQELAPYYDEAEKLWGVREFDPEPDMRALVKGITRNGAGWKAEPLPLALAAEIITDPLEARHFDAFASAKGYKAESQRSLLEPLRRDPNLTVLTNQPVVRLIGADHQPERITGVETAAGATLFAPSGCCSRWARCTRRVCSRIIWWQRVWRSACRVIGWSGVTSTPYLYRDAGAVAEPQDRFAAQDAGAAQRALPAQQRAALGLRRRVDGDIISELLAALVRPRHGKRAYGLFLQTEDGSDERNRVRAANGMGKPQLDYDPLRTKAAASEHRQLVRALQKSLLRAGFIAPSKSVPLAGTAHACGTLVTGADPTRSVVDGLGKVHGMDNLYVVDGSILPRSSRVNPSLTIYAWALRVAAHLPPAGVRS
ncbi:MAG: FAD-dependent oxidoreductase [Gammaproteobacteria bacterium]